ncbi:MAG: response regulator [Lachnospiraceae bacterium]|nr:response regulator [Lachnospiraceae bacterium]
MKILVIDDYSLIVEDVIDEVKKLVPDCECIGTTDAKEALRLNKKEKFDIVFSDIEMPEMNGIEMGKKIIEVNPKVNLIFITGYSGYAYEAFGLYASAFLTKPITSKKIKEALSNLRHPINGEAEKAASTSASTTASADSTAAIDKLLLEYYQQGVLGSRITFFREKAGLTKRQFAEKMEVSLQTIYRWENGERLPDILTFMRISRILGVNSDTLLL